MALFPISGGLPTGLTNQRLQLSADVNLPIIGTPIDGGMAQDSSGGIAVELAGAVQGWVFFQGQDPTNPLGAAGDWALLKALMDLCAYKYGIILGAGSIRVDSKVKTPSGTIIQGQPGTRLVQTLPNDADFQSAAFAATFGPTLSTTTLAANVKRGSPSIVTASNLAVGNIIVVSNANGGNSPGLRTSVHVVKEAAGANANLDRSIPRDMANGDPIAVVASIPQDIYIDGGGMLMTGTGVRYSTLAFARHCAVGNIRVDASQGMISDIGFSFDIGGYHNLFHDIVLDMDRLFSSLAGIALESNDHSRVERCEVNRSGGTGIIFYDCADCVGPAVSASFCQDQGILLTSDTAIHSATTRGCDHCTISGASSSMGNGQAGAGFAGVLVDQGSRDCDVSVAVEETLGLGWKVGDGTTFTTNNTIRGTSRNNGTTAALINTNANGTLIADDFDITGNGISNVTGVGLDVRADCVVENLLSSSGNNVHLIDHSAGRLEVRGGDCTVDAGAAVDVILSSTGELVIGKLRESIGTNCNGIHVTGGTAQFIAPEIIALHPAIETGIVVDAGTPVVGRQTKLDNVFTPILLQASGNVAIEQSGLAPVVMTAADHTLTWSEAQCRVIEASGAFGADRTVTAPSLPGLCYDAVNNSSAAHDLIMATAAGGAIHVVQNDAALVGVAANAHMVRRTANSVQT